MPENGASTPLPPGGGLPPEPQVQDPAARKSRYSISLEAKDGGLGA